MIVAEQGNAAETAVVRGLARSWSRRAAVKKAEPDLDALFDLDKTDYPDALLPFADHDGFVELDEHLKDRLRSWAWIAFNKNVMDIEEYVVNPGFDLIAHDGLDSGIGDSVSVAVHQAMVDEQYHTLMHLNASAVMRRRRGWAMPNNALPEVHTVRTQRRTTLAEVDPRLRALSTFAYTTVAEISISAYLDLISDDPEVQPVNRATVRVHNRDERAHAAITDDIAEIVYDSLNASEQRHYLNGLAEAMNTFSSNDFTVWRAIVNLEGVPRGRALIDDVSHASDRRRLVQDFSGIERLCTQLGVHDLIEFDWS
ncbi:diiron oxygenase [Rhodococcus sp. NPDC058521]|uniref:diiron oxygenase n=1 Tax=Rhodococcus sp. NPDC058521 TaxID=3346536 RepID=UPI00365D59ED